jgi:hypothetical protein
MPAGAWLAIIGGILLAVGTLLPWMTFGLGELTRNGFQLGADESLTADGPVLVLLGVLTAVIGITRLTNSSMPRGIQRSTLVTGLISGAVVGLNWSGIHSLVQNVQGTGTLAQVGYGYWICAIGAGLAVFSGFILRPKQAKTPKQARQKTGTAWVVAIVIVALVLGAVGAGLVVRPDRTSGSEPVVHSAATTTTSLPGSVSTDPSPTNGQDIQIMTTGCRSLQGLVNVIDAAESDASAASALSSANVGSGSPWYDVSAMQGVGAMPAYHQIATDTTGFTEAWSVAETTGDTTALNSTVVTLEVDCGTLNLPTAATS